MGEAVEHFSYDKVGNRTTDAKTGTNNWNYNQNNELQSFDDTSFKYNLNGQMTEKTVNGQKTTFSYNLGGRLSEIKDSNGQTLARYEYDPFGRRTKKYLPQINNTIYFHYSNEGVVAEYNENGQLIQSYGYQPYSYFTTDPVFSYRPDFLEAKGYAYYINDHLGTPQKLITNTGRKVWEASEDAFGQTIINNDEFRNPLRFAGQYFDNESNLRYNYFRYYDPTLGRYITSDPIGLIGGLNAYGYVSQNSVNLTDVFGLYEEIKLDPKFSGNAEKYSRDMSELKKDIELLEKLLKEQTKGCSETNKYINEFLRKYKVIYSPQLMVDDNGNILNGKADYEEGTVRIGLNRGTQPYGKVNSSDRIDLLGHEVRHLMSRNHNKSKPEYNNPLSGGRNDYWENDAENVGRTTREYFEDPAWYDEMNNDYMCGCLEE